MLRFFDVEVRRPMKRSHKESLQTVGVGDLGVREDLLRQVIPCVQRAGLKQKETYDRIRQLLGSCSRINGDPFEMVIDPNYSVIIRSRLVPAIIDPEGFDLDAQPKKRSPSASLGLG